MFIQYTESSNNDIKSQNYPNILNRLQSKEFIQNDELNIQHAEFYQKQLNAIQLYITWQDIPLPTTQRAGTTRKWKYQNP